MTRSALLVAAAFLATALPATAQTGTQVVSAIPAAMAVEPGGVFGFDVVYDTAPTDTTLAGLGLSMHWDSTKLQDPEISDLLATSLIGQQILDDASDLDGDPATDRRLLIAWLDVGGEWPGALPQRLFGVSFAPTPGFVSPATATIRFARSSSAAQWGFSASPVTVTAVSAPGGSAFYGLAPCRVFDTRQPGGPTGGQPLPAAGGVDPAFQLTGGACGVPAGAVAVSANVTVTQSAAAGGVSFFPGGGVLQATSTTSFPVGGTRANNTILKLAPSGDGTVRVRNGSTGTVHLIVDVNGYFLLSGS